jgi:hypothetical protein
MRECCKDKANHEFRSTSDKVLVVGGREIRGSETLRVCRVCGLRHFTLEAEAGRLGVAPAK